MNTIIYNEDIKKQIEEITKLFTSEQIEEIARLTGFVQRSSKLTGTIFLSIFTLGMNMYQRPSITQLLGLLKTLHPDFEISREGFQQRINESAVTFFEFMLSQAINISVKEVDLNILSCFKRVLILDSTIIELPDELAYLFKGYGGNASESSMKFQFCYDLKSGKFFYFIQDGTSSDGKYENSFVHKINADDLIIKDMGYFNPKAFIDLSEKGAFFLSRWRSNTELFFKDESGMIFPLEMAKLLTNIKHATELEVFIKHDDKLCKVRLVIEKVPESVKKIRLKKLKTSNQKKSRKSKDITLILLGYNVFLSNIPKECISMNNFRKLYGIRWQIELVFKNWKSNFHLDKISGIKIERIKCMLYSRLLMIFLSSKIIYQIRNIYWIENRIELSEFKSSKHLLITFFEVLKLSIKKQEKDIQKLLRQAFDFIQKNCKKLQQKGRSYPLDIISSMTLT